MKQKSHFLDRFIEVPDLDFGLHKLATRKQKEQAESQNGTAEAPPVPQVIDHSVETLAAEDAYFAPAEFDTSDEAAGQAVVEPASKVSAAPTAVLGVSPVISESTPPPYQAPPTAYASQPSHVNDATERLRMLMAELNATGGLSDPHATPTWEVGEMGDLPHNPHNMEEAFNEPAEDNPDFAFAFWSEETMTANADQVLCERYGVLTYQPDVLEPNGLVAQAGSRTEHMALNLEMGELGDTELGSQTPRLDSLYHDTDAELHYLSWHMNSYDPLESQPLTLPDLPLPPEDLAASIPRFREEGEPELIGSPVTELQDALLPVPLVEQTMLNRKTQPLRRSQAAASLARRMSRPAPMSTVGMGDDHHEHDDPLTTLFGAQRSQSALEPFSFVEGRQGS